MDKLNVFYAENKALIVSLVHLLVVIPLIFLALRPEFAPMMLRRDWVLYAVYAFLALGVFSHGATLVKDIKERVEKKKASAAVSEEPAVETPAEE